MNAFAFRRAALGAFVNVFGVLPLLGQGSVTVLRWENIGPGGGGAYYEAAWHPTKPDVLLVGSDVGGLYKSTNNAASWRVSAQIDPAQTWREQVSIYTVERLTYAPGSPDLVFAACWRGVFRSADAGETWKKVIDAPFPSFYGAVAVDPQDANIVLVASGGRYQYSPYASALGLATPYTAPAGYYWRSTDGGHTFVQAAGSGLPENFAATDLWIDPGSPAGNRMVILATFDGIFRSSDGGRTFVASSEGLTHPYVWDMDGGVHSDGRSVVYVTLQLSGRDPSVFDAGVFRSTDGGATWKNVTANIPTFDPDVNDGFWDWSVAVHPTNPDIAYVSNGNNDSTQSGVFKTINGGQSWTHVSADWTKPGFVTGYLSALTGQPGRSGNFLAISKADPNRLVFGNLFEVYHTSDGGATWQECYSGKVNADSADRRYASRGSEDTFVYDFAFDPADPSILWIGFEDVFMWETRDRGASMAHLKPEMAMLIRNRSADACWQLLPDPKRRGAYYAAMASPSSGVYQASGAVVYSTDGGETWIDISGNLPLGRPELVLGPPPEGQTLPTIYAAVTGHGMFKTTDHGQTWSEIANGFQGGEKTNVYRLAIDAGNPRQLWVGLTTDLATVDTTGGLYRTRDGGDTWAKLTQFPAREVFALEFHQGKLFAGASTEVSDNAEGGIFVSSDGGDTWERVMDQLFIRAITVDPNDANILYAAASMPPNLSQPPKLNPGIFRSADGGATWRQISQDLPHYTLTALAVDPLNSSHLYVGTLGLGALRAVLSPGGPPTFTLSGLANYDGSATGAIIIAAYTDATFTNKTGQATLIGPGSYSISGLKAGSYFLLAFRDANSNGTREANEPVYSASTAVDLNANVANVDLNLSDPAARLEIVSVRIVEQGIEITSTAVTGRTYALEYQGDLSGPAWIRLKTQVAAGATVVFVDDTLGNAAQRFYRVADLGANGGGPTAQLDLGVTPSYEIAFNKDYDFARLAQDGIKRVSLYFTFKEFEIGLRDPTHPEGLDIAAELDPVIQKLQSFGMRASLILELTHTDCDESAPESCWLEYGIPQELLYDGSGNFVGFDHEALASRVETVVKVLAQRYSPTVVTHLLIGNETDQYLRLHGHFADFKTLIQRVRTALETVAPRPQLGTIFTFAPDADVADYNALAREMAPAVDVMGFTMYPYLFPAVAGQRITPTADLVTKWLNAAHDAMGGRPFVVTETAHPGGGDWGSEADQAAYARFVLDYLKGTMAPIQFVTWWCIEDSETHPFDGFRFTGLMTNDHAAKRPAYNLWAAGSKF